MISHHPKTHIHSQPPTHSTTTSHYSHESVAVRLIKVNKCKHVREMGRTDRQTDRPRGRQIDRPRDRQTYRQRVRQTDREAGRQTDRQTDGRTK